jgi:ELWxxDGT repeat protein
MDRPPRIRVCSLALSLFAPLCLGAPSAPRQVADINLTDAKLGSDPTMSGRIGERIILKTSRGTWSTDGTSAGTVRISNRSASGAIVVDGNVGAFVAPGTSIGTETRWELWITDATIAGTRKVSNVRLNDPSDRPAVVGFANNRVLYRSRIAGSDTYPPSSPLRSVLYAYDLTAGTTTEIAAVTPQNALTHGGRIYFASDGHPWVTDGTATGTRRIVADGTDLPNPAKFAAIGQYVVFVGSADWLWSIDSATDAITPLGLKAPGKAFETFGTSLAFGGSASASVGVDTELWLTDGTPPGTRRVVDLAPGNASGFSGGTAVIGARIVFVGSTDGGNNSQLWSTDGTQAGTISLSTRLGGKFSTVLRLDAGEIAYYDQGAALYQTDGTPAGTRQVDGQAGRKMVGNSQGVYIARSVSGAPFPGQMQLWRLDPTTGTLDLLTTFEDVPNPVDAPSQFEFIEPGLLQVLGARLLFRSTNGGFGMEPWISDGTAAGTHLLKNLGVSGPASGSSLPHLLTDMNGEVFFAANDGVSGLDVWRSDGTESGTRLAADITMSQTGGADDKPTMVSITASSNAAYVFTYFGDHSNDTYYNPGVSELWHISRAGVARKVGRYGSNRPAVSLNDALFFVQSDGVWKVDGAAPPMRYVAGSGLGGIGMNLSAAGSTLYINQGGTLTASNGVAAPQPLFTGVGSMAARDGRLYFLRSENDVVLAASTAGTAATTVNYGAVVASSGGTNTVWRQLTPARNGIYVTNPDSCTGLRSRCLLSFIGENATAAHVTNRPDSANPMPVGDGSRAVFQSGSVTYLEGPSSYFTLMATDGTAASVQPLKEFSPLEYSSLSPFADFNGRAVFFATRRDDITEVWETSGRPDGTRMRGEIPSRPYHTAVASNHRLFFSVETPEHGFELWALDNAAPIAGSDTASDVTAGSSISIEVLRNDSDADGSLHGESIRIVRQPSLGSAVPNSEGQVVYTPRNNASGADSFEYVVADDQRRESAAATVSVTVLPNSNPPASGSSGGGGSLGIVEILLLALFSAGRRRRRAAPDAS